MRFFLLSTVLLVCLSFSAALHAQSKYVGTYRLGDPNIKESSLGLLRISEVQGKHVLDLEYHHAGTTSRLTGDLSVQADKNSAVFFADKGKKPCALIIQFKGSEAFVIQDSEAAACGWTADTDITGSYQKISDKVEAPAAPAMRAPK